MGKKKHRKSYNSKGQRPNVSASTLKSAAREACPLQSAMNKIDAWRQGKNPWITVKGTESNKPFIRVRANTLWGSHKNRFANLFGAKEKAQS